MYISVSEIVIREILVSQLVCLFDGYSNTDRKTVEKPVLPEALGLCFVVQAAGVTLRVQKKA